MKSSEMQVAYASLDIGTSQVKLGVYCAGLSENIILIGNLPNEIIYGTAGEVLVDYRVTREICRSLLTSLGNFLKKQNINTLYLGICGHVSSLLEWNRESGTPPDKPFPIWLDTTCYNSLDEYNDVMGNGKSREIIGTFLPAGTNWLFTKLLNRKAKGFTKESIFLQAGDAIYYELTGNYNTHFSSQISMVNLKTRSYASPLLEYLNLAPSSLPSITIAATPVREQEKISFGLPEKSFVFPAMADLYTSLYGLRLQDKEGFMLANTSEQAGAFYLEPPGAVLNFQSISFGRGFVNYGSTNTGGNIVSWFITNILKKQASPELLKELTTMAIAIRPESTPVILPYLQGERAPLWNSRLTASIHELNSTHTDVHLFRAILESVSFARKQCFEELGINSVALVKLGGGSSKNALWNNIRATVLNKTVAVADEKELAMAGIIYYIMEASGSACTKPAINFSMIKPVAEETGIYEEKYRRFLKYQKMLL
jgi:sugar (pentulose or hexulose) kinase